jgi:hypothetical protein
VCNKYAVRHDVTLFQGSSYIQTTELECTIVEGWPGKLSRRMGT